MSQVTKPIDITTTFVPVDPQTFPMNMMATEKQDGPTRPAPIMAYEGYNFLPTSYGYKAYFGTDATFDLPAFPMASVNVDKVFLVGTLSYTNFFVLLADTGIYVNQGGSGDDWIQVVTLVAPVLPIHEEWTVAVIGTSLYMYRAKELNYYRLPAVFTTTLDTLTSNFLNMEGQRGLFRAGSRLGFWDSEGSVSWSNIDDYEDFTPSVITLAGSAIFTDVQGAIVTIRSCGDGFIIYATNSITYVQRDLNSAFQWNPEVVLQGNGIAYSTQVAVTSPDTTQFAYTNIGLHKIEGGRIANVITDTTDLLQESLFPIALDIVENRYLILHLIEDKFVEGLVEFESITYEAGLGYEFTQDDIDSATTGRALEIISGGHLASMQADARGLALAAGYAADRIGGFAIPIWEYSMGLRDTTLITPSNPYGTVSKPLADPVPVGGMEYLSTHSLAIAPSISNVFSIGVYGRTPTYNPTEEPSAFSFRLEGDRALWSVIGHFRSESARISSTISASVNAAAGANVASVSDFAFIEPSGTNFILTSCGLFGQEYYTGSVTKQNRYERQLPNFGSPFGWDTTTGNSISNNFPDFNPLFPDKGNAFDVYYNGSYPFYPGAPTNAIGLVTCNLVGYKIPIAGLGDVEFPVTTCFPDGEYPFSGDSGEDLEPKGTPLNPYPWVLDPLDLPEYSINLQRGSPGPVYPTYSGALVYDTEYKKWGKIKCKYKQMLDLSPINTNQGRIVTTKRFGIDAGVLQLDGRIHRFDKNPAESYIKYGKIGYYRLGFTTLEEVRIQFRTPCTGSLLIEGSLDGRNPEGSLKHETPYDSVTSYTVYPSMSARWHTITFKGNFDITHLEYRGVISGRR